jgi:hypothetical protein
MEFPFREQDGNLQVEAVRTTSPAPLPVDTMAFKRGAAAYQGLNRTDPDAIWSFQGWAIIDWYEIS